MNEESAAKLVAAHRARRNPEIRKATKLLVEAHRARSLAMVGDVELKTDGDAYRVQDAVYARLWPGTKPLAWKAGAPSDKVEPTAAPIAPEKVLRSPASVSAATLNLIGVEAEVAYRLGRDLPPRARPYLEKDLAAAVDEVLVAIEVCATRIAAWKQSSGPWRLADFQSNGVLVAGSGTRQWRSIDFLGQQLEFTIGARVVRAKGAHPFGNPFRLLPWLARHCSKRGAGLSAGNIVTTGAWTGLEPAAAGDEVSARFPGIGEARVRIEADGG
jgi:2-keto-4-pentenoate hydratase